jgi:hypothetical protein
MGRDGGCDRDTFLFCPSKCFFVLFFLVLDAKTGSHVEEHYLI